MNVLVVAAHPDDEILGCGATMAKHVKHGDKVNVLIIGDGITSRYSEDELEKKEVIDQVERLKLASVKASKIIGVSSIDIVGFNCCRFDKIPLLDITKVIEEKIREHRPERIYTHGPYDANNDHIIVFRAVQIATRPITGTPVKEVLLMEVLSSTEWDFINTFKPDVYEDVEKHIGQKIKALEAFGEENRDFPHPRSVKMVSVLAEKRGSEVGVKAAEAFQLFRLIR